MKTSQIATFDQAFAELLTHEGGYVDHPSDPGGATNHGVTERVARKFGYTGNMRGYPKEEAAKVYRSEYWEAVRADELPAPLRYPIFDAAVNSGSRQAILWLQQGLDVKTDGVIGAQTLAAIKAADPNALLCRMLGARLRFMTNLNHWNSFGKGWARRIAAMLEKP